MAIGRVYNVDSGLATGISVGTGGVPGTEYTILYGVTTATSELNVSAVRVATWSGSSASYPSNGTITWRLRRATGGVTAGIFIGTATAAPISQSALAAQATWLYSTVGALGTGTFGAYGNVLWSQTTPCTAGANWGEWFTPGFELNVPATATLAVTYELGAAGTIQNVNLVPELVISE